MPNTIKGLFEIYKTWIYFFLVYMCVNESGEGEDMVRCAMVRHESNLTFMQDIVLIEELNYTGADDAAE